LGPACQWLRFNACFLFPTSVLKQDAHLLQFSVLL